MLFTTISFGAVFALAAASAGDDTTWPRESLLRREVPEAHDKLDADKVDRLQKLEDLVNDAIGHISKHEEKSSSSVSHDRNDNKGQHPNVKGSADHDNQPVAGDHAQIAKRVEGHEALHDHNAGVNSNTIARLKSKLVDEIAKAARKDGVAARTSCARNTYIGDWGSTGARVFLAHKAKNATASSPEFMKDFGSKISIAEWLNLNSSANGMQELFKTLKEQLPSTAEPLMVAMATAGNRLERATSDLVWEKMQAQNARDNLMQECNATAADGCRTLPGATEAKFEFNSAYDGETGDKLRGMISAGGASLQMAFEVADENMTQADECVKEIRAATKNRTEYIEKAVGLSNGKQLITLSWLANRNEDKQDEFAVGGTNEMAASFERSLVMDHFGVTQNQDHDGKWAALLNDTTKRASFPKHPCLPGAWPVGVPDYWPNKTDNGENNSGPVGTGVDYLLTPWGGYVSMLQGDPNATTKTCGDAVSSFIKRDFMVKAFFNGKCKALAADVKQWKLITSFFYLLKDMPGFKGYKVNKIETENTGDALKSAWTLASGYDYTSHSYNSKPLPNTLSDYGSHFFKTLLMEVLEEFGVMDGSDIVDAVNAEWLQQAGKKMKVPLAPGWIADADCDP